MIDISAECLLAHLDYLGFCLEVRGKKLRVSPAHELTDAYRQAIKENKRELIALLRFRAAEQEHQRQYEQEFGETFAATNHG